MRAQLSPNFWLNEFTDSETAMAIGDPNEPTPEALKNLQELAFILEGVRYFLDERAIVISSGYRSPAVNAAVGGVANSDHVLGMAADLKVPGYGSPREVCEALAPHIETLGIKQLIHEFGAWVHLSIKEPANPVNKILTIDKHGVRAGIHKARV
jgi:zinc D-Ala-D-Ala carboxypeptidase